MLSENALSVIYDARTMSKFWSKVDILGKNECWAWTAGIDGKGYGGFQEKGIYFISSRLAWIYAFGDPMDLKVLHRCDNPPCCNPNHLFLGTLKDNMVDKTRKGRNNAPRGERSGTHKLTEREVLEIRELSKTNTQSSIAKRFGISFQNVSDIVRRKRWTWLEDNNE